MCSLPASSSINPIHQNWSEGQSESLDVVAKLADSFRESAVVRDRERRLPYWEIEQLSAAGVYGATIPEQFGGADLPPSPVAEMLRLLAVPSRSGICALAHSRQQLAP